MNTFKFTVRERKKINDARVLILFWIRRKRRILWELLSDLHLNIRFSCRLWLVVIDVDAISKEKLWKKKQKTFQNFLFDASEPIKNTWGQNRMKPDLRWGQSTNNSFSFRFSSFLSVVPFSFLCFFVIYWIVTDLLDFDRCCLGCRWKHTEQKYKQWQNQKKKAR